MYIEEEYPTEDGEVKHVMSYTTDNANLLCEKRKSMPVFIAKCGEKYYHRVDTVSGSSVFCLRTFMFCFSAVLLI